MLGLSLLFSYRATSQNAVVLDRLTVLSEQNKVLGEQNKQLAEQSAKDAANINATLICIFQFFNADIDRQQVRILTYSPCVFVDKSTGKEVSISTEPSATSSTPQASGQGASTGRSSEVPLSSSNSTPGNQTSLQNTSQLPSDKPHKQNFIQRWIARLFK